jgi:tetratricopeptide (TPR) repeat protein
MVVRTGKYSIASPSGIAAVGWLVAAVILLQLPLLNYIGYEFSVAVSLLLIVSAGVLLFLEARKIAFRGDKKPSERFEAFALASLRQHALLLVVPLLLGLGNAVFVKNCSILEGLAYYFLIPGISMLWLTALALCSLAFAGGFSTRAQKKPRTGRAICIYAAAVLLTLLYGVFIGYRLPQIFSYNFIYGYFPGVSYDESLSITPTFLLFRLLTALCALWLFLLGALYIRLGEGRAPFRKRGLVALPGALALLTIVLIFSWFEREAMGFEYTSRSVEDVLSGVVATEHFRIHYLPGSFTDSELREIAELHEFRLSQVETALQTPEEGKVIASYIYPDDETKLKFIGTATTNIAKPWRHEIHLDKSSWQQTLKHELVHVVAGEFGMPVIRAHYNIGLVEGLAMAVDPAFGNRTLHEYAAGMIKFRLIGDPVRLIHPVGFALHASTVSYVMMGSFCSYLIDHYGMMRFKELYGGASGARVYGKSYEQLAEEWESYLTRVDVPESWKSHIDFYFNRPSIFAKVCARTVARLNDNGYRMLSEHNIRGAIGQFRDALETSWNTDSYAGLVRAAYDTARFDSVVHLMEKVLRDSSSRASVTNILLLYGDASWNTGDTARARQVFSGLLRLDLSERLNELAAIRLQVTSREAPPLRDSLMRFISGGGSDSVRLLALDRLSAASDSGLISYLKGKIYLRMGKWKDAVLSFASVRGRFPYPALNARREQLAAQAFFHMQRYEEAKIHFWKSLNFTANRASILDAEEWIECCEWMSANHY